MKIWNKRSNASTEILGLVEMIPLLIEIWRSWRTGKKATSSSKRKKPI